MIPLRVFGILTNIVLIATAIPSSQLSGHLWCRRLVLVLNSYRLHQMLQLVRDVKKSVNSDLSMEWLKPFMTERKCAAGEVLFYKDEKAEDMLYIVSGRFRLVESGIELPVGAIVGELGMLSPSNMRTQTLECIEAGVVLSVSYTKVEELYVQNPAFGFYFLRLASARLFQNIDKLEQRLAQQTAARRRLRRNPLEGPERQSGKRPVLAPLSARRFHRRGRRRAAIPARGLARSGRADRQRRHPAADRLSGHRATRSFMSTGCGGSSAARGVDDAMFGEIARLMAMRMSYEDPIRIAQLKLAELDEGCAGDPRVQPPTMSGNSGSTNWSARSRRGRRTGARRARMDRDGCTSRSRSASAPRSRWGIRRLKIEASLAAMAAVLGALCQGAGLGRTLAAHDRPQPGQAASGRRRDRADRDHDPGLWRRLSPGPGRLARDHRWPRQADLRRRAALAGSCRRGGGGARRRHARSAAGRAQAHDRARSGRGRCCTRANRRGRTSRPVAGGSRALRGLDDHHIVVMAGVRFR